VIAGFEDILVFVREHGRAPLHGEDRRSRNCFQVVLDTLGADSELSNRLFVEAVIWKFRRLQVQRPVSIDPDGATSPVTLDGTGKATSAAVTSLDFNDMLLGCAHPRQGLSPLARSPLLRGDRRCAKFRGAAIGFECDRG
jgi:hypothetical protein